MGASEGSVNNSDRLIYLDLGIGFCANSVATARDVSQICDGASLDRQAGGASSCRAEEFKWEELQ
jgi:hypothetical protein